MKHGGSRWFIFGIAPRVPLSSVRFRSEDGVGPDTDAAAARCALRVTTFQPGRCAPSQGLESRPSAPRMISLLTSADSKASLIQQRQQRISACKPSPWRLTQLYFFFTPPPLYVANVTSRSISPAPLFGVRGTAGLPLRSASLRAPGGWERGERRLGEEGWSCSRRRASCCRLTITS